VLLGGRVQVRERAFSAGAQCGGIEWAERACELVGKCNMQHTFPFSWPTGRTRRASRLVYHICPLSHASISQFSGHVTASWVWDTGIAARTVSLLETGDSAAARSGREEMMADGDARAHVSALESRLADALAGLDARLGLMQHKVHVLTDTGRCGPWLAAMRACVLAR
jgi:hypothetical protein